MIGAIAGLGQPPPTNAAPSRVVHVTGHDLSPLSLGAFWTFSCASVTFLAVQTESVLLRLLILIPVIGLTMFAFAIAQIVTADRTIAMWAAVLVGGLSTYVFLRMTARPARLPDDPDATKDEVDQPATPAEAAYRIGLADLSSEPPLGGKSSHCFLLPMAVQRHRGDEIAPLYTDLSKAEKAAVGWVFRAAIRNDATATPDEQLRATIEKLARATDADPEREFDPAGLKEEALDAEHPLSLALEIVKRLTSAPTRTGLGKPTRKPRETAAGPTPVLMSSDDDVEDLAHLEREAPPERDRSINALERRRQALLAADRREELREDAEREEAVVTVPEREMPGRIRPRRIEDDVEEPLDLRASLLDTGPDTGSEEREERAVEKASLSARTPTKEAAEAPPEVAEDAAEDVKRKPLWARKSRQSSAKGSRSKEAASQARAAEAANEVTAEEKSSKQSSPRQTSATGTPAKEALAKDTPAKDADSDGATPAASGGTPKQEQTEEAAPKPNEGDALRKAAMALLPRAKEEEPSGEKQRDGASGKKATSDAADADGSEDGARKTPATGTGEPSKGEPAAATQSGTQEQAAAAAAGDAEVGPAEKAGKTDKGGKSETEAVDASSSEDVVAADTNVAEGSEAKAKAEDEPETASKGSKASDTGGNALKEAGPEPEGSDEIEPAPLDTLGEPRALSEAGTYLWLEADPDPDLWQIILWNLDWEKELDPLYCAWVVQRPECDRATAADLFIALGGIEVLGVPREEIENLLPAGSEFAPVIRAICDRCEGEGYPRAELRSEFIARGGTTLEECRQMLAEAEDSPEDGSRLSPPRSLFADGFPDRRPSSRYTLREGRIVYADAG